MRRIALYSHDTFGLGHLRRSLKLADHLRAHLGAVEGLLVTGSAWHSLFPLPPDFRLSPLPPVEKCDSGTYASRDTALDLRQVLAERRRRISDRLAAFAPDLLVVDNVPCGLRGEILPALGSLRARGARTVLALRDVLDDPRRIRREWETQGADVAAAELFDQIWVFGDAADTAALIDEGPLAAVAHKVHSCGRIGQLGATPIPAKPAEGPTVLVTGGGGRDAAPLVATYLEAVRTHRPLVTSEIVLGPDFPAADKLRLPAPGLETTIADFVPDLPGRMARSRVVVSMAGYNSVCEILASGRPAVLVPRVSPRQEQLLRARRWAREGRARLLDPAELTPATLWSAVADLLTAPPLPPLASNGGHVAAARAAALLDVSMVGAA